MRTLAAIIRANLKNILAARAQNKTRVIAKVPRDIAGLYDWLLWHKGRYVVGSVSDYRYVATGVSLPVIEASHCLDLCSKARFDERAGKVWPTFSINQIVNKPELLKDL